MNGMMPSMPGFPMAPGAFPPFFVPGNPMQTGGWSAPPDDRGGHGPIRRGGMQRPYRAGPYDRRPNPRYDGSGGGRYRGGGRWGDGAAGGAAVGPREAVQGRSLKSYEDLDHVASGGGGELNY